MPGSKAPDRAEHRPVLAGSGGLSPALCRPRIPAPTHLGPFPEVEAILTNGRPHDHSLTSTTPAQPPLHRPKPLDTSKLFAALWEPPGYRERVKNKHESVPQAGRAPPLTVQRRGGRSGPATKSAFTATLPRRTPIPPLPTRPLAARTRQPQLRLERIPEGPSVMSLPLLPVAFKGHGPDLENPGKLVVQGQRTK